MFFGKAPGYADQTSSGCRLPRARTRTLEITLAQVAPCVRWPKPATSSDFEDPDAWKKDGDLWVHRGGGFVPYKLGPKGMYTFTVELVHGGNVFKGGRIRWCVQYVDAKNYLLYELDQKTFWAEVVEKGKKLERAKTQHELENQKAFTIQIEVTPEHVVHRIKNPSGQWVVLDSFAEPGRNFTAGQVRVPDSGQRRDRHFRFHVSPQIDGRFPKSRRTRRQFLQRGAGRPDRESRTADRRADSSTTRFRWAIASAIMPGFTAPPRIEKFPIVIVGGGMAGLSAAWRLHKRGFRDFVLLEMEPQPGGNSRWGENEITAYPWAAHYVPVPDARATLVRELFEELGVLKDGMWDERRLCFAPQERLFLHGRWQEGIEPR